MTWLVSHPETNVHTRPITHAFATEAAAEAAAERLVAQGTGPAVVWEIDDEEVVR